MNAAQQEKHHMTREETYLRYAASHLDVKEVLHLETSGLFPNTIPDARPFHRFHRLSRSIVGKMPRTTLPRRTSNLVASECARDF